MTRGNAGCVLLGFLFRSLKSILFFLQWSINLSSMTSCLAALAVRIAQFHSREGEGNALEMGAKTEQLHNCTKEKGFFCFVFFLPISSCLLKKCCWKAGWKKLQHRSSLWGHEIYWNVPPVLWLVLFLFQVWHLQEGAKRPYTANLHRGH